MEALDMCPYSAMDALNTQGTDHKGRSSDMLQAKLESSVQEHAVHLGALSEGRPTCTSQRTKSPALKALLGIVAAYRFAPAEAVLKGQDKRQSG